MSRPAEPRRDEPIRLVASNKKARFDFEILDTIEAGLVLTGTEVKSLRGGKVNLKDGFVRFENGEAWLFAVHVSVYFAGSWTNHEPERPRKLLLKKRERARLSTKVNEKGLALVPLKMYFRGSWAKVELGLGRGKKSWDRRDTIRERELNREAEAAMKDSRRSR